MRLLPTIAAAITMAQIAPAYADCFRDAATRYHLNVDLLAAIADEESGHRQHAVNYNANGTKDICKMQINSGNFAALERRFGITQQHLRSDECTCVYVGAWFLADEIRRHGNTWMAVARYHIGSGSKNMEAGRAYAARVKAHYDKRAAHRPKEPS